MAKKRTIGTICLLLGTISVSAIATVTTIHFVKNKNIALTSANTIKSRDGKNRISITLKGKWLTNSLNDYQILINK